MSRKKQGGKIAELERKVDEYNKLKNEIPNIQKELKKLWIEEATKKIISSKIELDENFIDYIGKYNDLKGDISELTALADTIKKNNLKISDVTELIDSSENDDVTNDNETPEIKVNYEETGNEDKEKAVY